MTFAQGLMLLTKCFSKPTSSPKQHLFLYPFHRPSITLKGEGSSDVAASPKLRLAV